MIHLRLIIIEIIITRSVKVALASNNYRFYANQIPSTPSGDLIDVIHSNWFGNYGLLEAHHGYRTRVMLN